MLREKGFRSIFDYFLSIWKSTIYWVFALVSFSYYWMVSMVRPVIDDSRRAFRR